MKNRIIDRLKNNWLVNKTEVFLKKIRFRGGKLSLYFILKTFIQKVSQGELLERANAVAFSFTIAIFPAILFLFTLIPYIHKFIPRVDNESIIIFMGQILPPNMYVVMETTVRDIVSHSRGRFINLWFFSFANTCYKWHHVTISRFQ